MASPIDEVVGRQFQAELARLRVKQSTIAAVIGKNASQVSRLAHGRDAWTSEVASAVDAFLGTNLVELLSRRPHVDLYVAAPITGLDGSLMVNAHHEIGRVVQVLRRQVGSVHWPGEEILHEADLRDPDLSTEANMDALANAEAFLYLQFQEVVRPSSALIELGIALGRRTHTTIVVKSGLHLPFMLRENFEGVAGRIPQFPQPRFRVVYSVDRAIGLFEKNGRQLLGLPERRSAEESGLKPLI